jgi:hypothetical protein
MMHNARIKELEMQVDGLGAQLTEAGIAIPAREVADPNARLFATGRIKALEADVAVFKAALGSAKKAGNAKPAGGGAAVNAGGAKTMLRAEWQKLAANQRADFVRAGGRLVDSHDAEGAMVPAAGAANVTAADIEKQKQVITRAEFRKLSPQAQGKFCREGGRIVD